MKPKDWTLVNPNVALSVLNVRDRLPSSVQSQKVLSNVVCIKAVRFVYLLPMWFHPACSVPHRLLGMNSYMASDWKSIYLNRLMTTLKFVEYSVPGIDQDDGI